MDDTAGEPGAPEHGGFPDTPRYRPGRGGYDPAAAAAAARATYAFRQRMVLGLLLLAVASGLVAGGLNLTPAWFVHAGVDLCLVGYLVHLRRQVRLEEAIRARRAARMTGSGGRYADDATESGTERVLDRRARRRGTVADAVVARDAERRRTEQPDLDGVAEDDPAGEPGEADADAEVVIEGSDERPALDDVPALPRLRPVPPPERPFGTVVLELDDEDPELHDLDDQTHRGYRRAAGQ